jgi:hypothetical protein
VLTTSCLAFLYYGFPRQIECNQLEAERAESKPRNLVRLLAT